MFLASRRRRENVGFAGRWVEGTVRGERRALVLGLVVLRVVVRREIVSREADMVGRSIVMRGMIPQGKMVKVKGARIRTSARLKRKMKTGANGMGLLRCS
jgi:hypothetical protein